MVYGEGSFNLPRAGDLSQGNCSDLRRMILEASGRAEHEKYHVYVEGVYLNDKEFCFIYHALRKKFLEDTWQAVIRLPT